MAHTRPRHEGRGFVAARMCNTANKAQAIEPTKRTPVPAQHRCSGVCTWTIQARRVEMHLDSGLVKRPHPVNMLTRELPCSGSHFAQWHSNQEVGDCGLSRAHDSV